jgi:ABC-type phosphate/phosphonate transport system substrate-binding protein
MDFRVIEIASGDPDGDFLAVVPDNVGSLRVVFSATREDVEKEELKNIIDQLDFLLAMQGRLLFAKDSYDAEEAADFGAMLLAYFQSNGSTIRAALCAAEESKP